MRKRSSTSDKGMLHLGCAQDVDVSLASTDDHGIENPTEPVERDARLVNDVCLCDPGRMLESFENS